MMGKGLSLLWSSFLEGWAILMFLVKSQTRSSTCRGAGGIGILFLPGLGVAHFQLQELVKVVYSGGEGFRGLEDRCGGVHGELKAHAWVDAIVGQEGSRLSCFRDVVVACELPHREIGRPAFLLLEDVVSEVLLHNRVGPLCLPNCLWVEGGGQL